MSKPAVNPPQITPYPLALVVCDTCWKDPYTGKCTLIGTFSAIGGPAFPLDHPILTVYAALTDGLGPAKIRFQLVDCDEQWEPVFRGELEIHFDDPRTVIETAYQAHRLQFPEPGEYRLQLFANDEFAMERRIVVLETESQAETGDIP